jgi:hypothetical protein
MSPKKERGRTTLEAKVTHQVYNTRTRLPKIWSTTGIKQILLEITILQHAASKLFR